MRCGIALAVEPCCGHTIGKVTLYARVVRPASASVLVSASERIARSAFVAPRLAGHWNSGGVVWFSRIPGRNLRRHVRRGGRPDPESILDGLMSLWDLSDIAPQARAFSLKRRYVQAKRILDHATRGDDDLREVPAVRHPTTGPVRGVVAAVGHGPQRLLRRPDAGVAGRPDRPWWTLRKPGRATRCWTWATSWRIWGSRRALGRDSVSAATGACHAEFRDASLDRLTWEERELDLREAVCLFRICTSTIRHISPNWRGTPGRGVVTRERGVGLGRDCRVPAASKPVD